jgi:WD40 repeat protein
MSRACVDDDELQAYLERQLAPAARDDLEAHVAACPDCRTLLAATARALGGDGDDDRADDTVARTAPTHPLPPPVPGVPVRLPTVPYEAYVVDGEIARGGLGRVLRATDLRLGRTVALKVLLPGRERAEARFVHEAHITAGLEHPAIVPVHEAGRWPDGEPFYAMKLVSGQTLTDRIKQARTLGDRLALLPGVLRVVEAVAYAHSHGVIHRDLKPANVLCGQFGETVVIDWGLAKQLGAGEVPGPLAHIPDTKTGVVLGTPPYMPPEQARGEVVDGQADVYALGAILYELLSGSPPYAEAGKQVLDAVVAGPPRPLESLQEGVPRDLLAIVRKAMARDRAARYPTAGELAADLAHFQTGQLVSAREYSRWALWVRWLRRHRLPVAVAAAALIVVGTLAAISLSRVVHARAVAEDARAAEEQARRQAEARQHELVRLQARAIVDRDPTRALAWLAQIPATAPGWDEVRAVVIDAVSRGYARHVWRVDDKHTSIAFAPDGRWLISAGHGPMRVADPAGGRARALALPGGAFEAAFAADGTMAASGEDGTIAIYPPASIAGGDAVVRVLRQGGAPAVRTFIAIAPDGRTVATATDRNGDVTLWDVATGDARTFTGPADGARDLRFSPDGRTVATITIDRVLRLRDVATGAARELVGKDVASNFVFTADGTRALVAELSGIREWTLATGASRLLPLPRQGYITVAASADGATIAAAGFEGPIHLLDVASGQITTLGGHEALVVGLAFAPDGRTLASIAMDLTIRVWQRPTRRDRVLATVAGTAASPVFAPDGRTVAVGAGDGRVWLVPVDGGAPVALAGHTGAVFDVAFAPDGRTLATQARDRTVRAWDLARGESRVIARTAAWVDFGRLVFSPDGARLAASLDLETLAVIEIATGARVCTFGGGGFNLAHAFTPDGAAIGFTGDHRVLLGALAGCDARPLHEHDVGKSAYAIVIDRDGRFVASASDDATVGLFDRAAGTARRLRGHDSDVTAAAFVPGRPLLATGSGDRTLRLWDTGGGGVRELRGHESIVTSVRASPDGAALASTGLDPVIRLWDVASGAGTVLRGHRERVQGVAFSPDGAWLVSGSVDGTVRLWSADPRQGIPIAAAELEAWIEAATTARIDAAARAVSP